MLFSLAEPHHRKDFHRELAISRIFQHVLFSENEKGITTITGVCGIGQKLHSQDGRTAELILQAAQSRNAHQQYIRTQRYN